MLLSPNSPSSTLLQFRLPDPPRFASRPSLLSLSLCRPRATQRLVQFHFLIFQRTDCFSVIAIVVNGVCATTMTKRRQKIKCETSESADRNWDNLGFDPVRTDYMYLMKCNDGGSFADGGLRPYGNIELIPSACVLNYGQGIIEGLKAYKKLDGSLAVFRPRENGLRMQIGAQRMCMPAPTVEQFVEAVKETVLANRSWVPPVDKGFLHIRPLLMGSGPVLSLIPPSEYTFLIYVTPVKNYFKDGLRPISLVVETEIHRSTPGGVGNVKATGNYAGILKSQLAAKAKGFSDVLYVDCVHGKFLEEVSTANIFIVKGKTICTPLLEGNILPGITRKSMIEIAQSLGFQVDEGLVPVEKLFDADEVFCTGNAVCVLPIGSITYMDKRVDYGGSGHVVSHQLYTALANIQTGYEEDRMGWNVELK